MTDIAHNTMHRARKINLVLVVHGNTNEKFRLTHCTPDILAQFVAIRDKVIRITSASRIPHMRKLHVIAARKKAVQDGGDLALENEFAVNESDFLFRLLGLTSATADLCAFWCWTVMLAFSIDGFGLVVLFGESLVAHVGLSVAQFRSIVKYVVLINGYSGAVHGLF